MVKAKNAPNDFYFQRAGKLHFFCPLCHYHQSTSTINKVSLKHHFQIAIVTVATTALLWPLCGFKALFFHLVYWAGFELVYRFRKRQALVCESCGFDPFMYLRDADAARKYLKKHWQEKIERENLFQGIKLKNYKTTSVKGAAGAATDGAVGQPQENAVNAMGQVTSP